MHDLHVFSRFHGRGGSTQILSLTEIDWNLEEMQGSSVGEEEFVKHSATRDGTVRAMIDTWRCHMLWYITHDCGWN